MSVVLSGLNPRLSVAQRRIPSRGLRDQSSPAPVARPRTGNHWLGVHAKFDDLQRNAPANGNLLLRHVDDESAFADPCVLTRDRLNTALLVRRNVTPQQPPLKHA